MLDKQSKIIFPLFFKNKTGGAVQSAIRLMEFLKTKYSIIVITVNDIDIDFFNSISKYQVIKVKSLTGRISLKKLLNPIAILQVRNCFNYFSNKTDIIITNDFAAELLIGIAVPKYKRINVAHGGDYKTITGKILKTHTFKSVSKFIAVSNTEKSKLLEIGILPDNIDVIYNSLIPEKELSACSINKANINIACIGYYNDNKNQFLALESVNSLVKEGYNLKLNLYGGFEFSDKQYIEMLNEYIMTNNLQTCVKINDFTLNTIIFEHNQILISTSKNEGFGNTLLEAMIYKRAIVSTNSGGLSALLENGRTALITDDYSSDSLKYYLKMLIDNSNLYTLLVENAFNFYMKAFNHKSQMKKYEKAIIELLSI